MPYFGDSHYPSIKGSFNMAVAPWFDWFATKGYVIQDKKNDDIDISSSDGYEDVWKVMEEACNKFIYWKVFNIHPIPTLPDGFITTKPSSMPPDEFCEDVNEFIRYYVVEYVRNNLDTYRIQWFPHLVENDSSVEEDKPKIHPRNQIHECDVCGRTYKGFGNNAQPLKLMGQCCDTCNKYVVAYRILASQLDDLEECSTKDAYRKHLKEKKKEFIKQAIKEYEGSDDDE